MSEIINYIRENYRYDKESGKLFWNKPGLGRDLNKPVGSLRAEGYIRCSISIKGQKWFQLPATHIIWALEHGYLPEQIDHSNHIRADNVINNLSEVNSKKNSHNKSPYKINNRNLPACVYLRPSGNYRVIVQSERKRYDNTVKTLEEAITLRNSLWKELGFHQNHGV